MLLPVEERRQEEEEADTDPRWDLVRQLVEYKKFKDAAIISKNVNSCRKTSSDGKAI
jgi:chromatin segregation and condensation protein Rec8/ScpA/Scc1 (kleisin family)